MSCPPPRRRSATSTYASRKGVLTPPTLNRTPYRGHPEPFVAAFLNHRMFYYDGSKGLHHPQLAVGLLSNTLQYMRNNSSACN